MTQITPIRFTRHVEASRTFYAALGLVERSEETSRTWVSLRGSGGSLGLHIAAEATTADDPGAVSLQVTVADGELDARHTLLSREGYEPGAITDETFGRFFTVSDPDGYLVQVNETPAEFSRSYETVESASLVE